MVGEGVDHEGRYWAVMRFKSNWPLLRAIVQLLGEIDDLEFS